MLWSKLVKGCLLPKLGKRRKAELNGVLAPPNDMVSLIRGDSKRVGCDPDVKTRGYMLKGGAVCCPPCTTVPNALE
jgi:hypothetical protein